MVGIGCYYRSMQLTDWTSNFNPMRVIHSYSQPFLTSFVINCKQHGVNNYSYYFSSCSQSLPGSGLRVRCHVSVRTV